MTDKIDRFLKLLDLEKALDYEGYDNLGLENLGGLRLEVHTKILLMEIEDMRAKGANDDEILVFIKSRHS